ncbi:hypothetical protein WIMU106979_11610 [Williamsia muralis]
MVTNRTLPRADAQVGTQPYATSIANWVNPSLA